MQPQYYTAIIQKQDPESLSKLLELGDPDFFGCYISDRREANTVKVKSAAAAATTMGVPKLSNASITDERTDRLKLLDLGDPNFFGGGR